VTSLALRVHGATHTGNVREGNEDAHVLDRELGLYAVLDGMGGAMGGDVASAKARDVIHAYVKSKRQAMAPRDLMAAAIGAASAAVFEEAKSRRDRKGMGTTVVACLLVDERRAVIAHVGDSRAYLLREGRLQQLTRDHTIVAELLEKGAISPEDAAHSAYKSVLSRNLGNKPEARPDVVEIALQAGDRLLLCSDGLYGYASGEAVLHLLGGGEGPEQVTRDLIEAALRGGGGDNVTTIVLEVGRAAVPRATQVIRSTGAVSWWARRPLFLQAARDAGLAQSAICAVLSPEEAIEIVAGNLCEAVFHDLEQTTGINVWTYAENLAHGWFDQGGDYEVLRELVDILRGASMAVIADIRAGGDSLAIMLEIAVTRALIVAEVAIGNVLAERLRAIEAELVRATPAIAPPPPPAGTAALASSSTGLAASASGSMPQMSAEGAQQTFVEQRTIPYMQAVRIDPPSPAVARCLEEARARAIAAIGADDRAGRREVADCIERAHRAALAPTGPSDAVLAARELYGVRALEESGMAPLLDALDQARMAHVRAVRELDAGIEEKVTAMRRVSTAHQRMVGAVTALVIESGGPITARLQEATERTAGLRAEVGRNEARLAELERRAAAARAARPQIGAEP
jgi:serine/threonine protein phosphatase PrpC